jgi:methionine-rich copper-binding protein CopC
MNTGGPRWAGGGCRATARWGPIALCVAVIVGCARREPPSGGPPDIDAPFLVHATPDSGKAGVPTTATIELTFSEAMEPRYTSAAVSINPPTTVRHARWSGRTLGLVLQEPLKPNQTYTVYVGHTARDRHGNDMTSGATVVFSTAPTFPRGRIEGDLEAQGFEASGTYVWCYDAARTGVPDSTGRDFDAIGIVDAIRHFRVDGLAVPGRYRMWVFADLNANRSFEPVQDILTAVDTVVALTDSSPVAHIGRVTVVNPRSPGSVTGTVIDSLRDTTAVIRVIATSVADSTIRDRSDVALGGTFEFSLKAGDWDLRAFLDRDSDKEWRPSREPASPPVRVKVLPAGKITNVRLVLRGPP